ncbi:MAG: tRNA (adenosine(37)-N6)-dimethylallyltransferase MiaA [Verrucomicrobiaceae bacterium]|nr:MAG: tRNA (adenosine(37)-N6)-dimethylallyltransferase MiaA [Verrucomicrobiaceae bacterium]
MPAAGSPPVPYCSLPPAGCAAGHFDFPVKPKLPLPLYLTGPTGSGKSATALLLAERTGGEIICADAYQVYDAMPVLTAQPTPEERARAPHHLYGSVPVSEDMDAGRFEKTALAIIEDVRNRGKLPIVCGGSGLYIKSLTHGLSPLPPGDPVLRQELEAQSIYQLAERLMELDPGSADQLNLENPRHVVRALEICILTGKPASELKQSWAMPRPGVRGVFLDCQRQDLYERIDARTHAMVANGVLEEVTRLSDMELSTTASKAIGLWDFRAVVDEATSLEEAVASVQQATRNYAKRQVTWFRRETAFVNLEVSPGMSAARVAKRIADIFGF